MYYILYNLKFNFVKLFNKIKFLVNKFIIYFIIFIS